MTRYLLDTNIVSHLARVEVAPSLAEWMEVQQARDLFMSTMTVAEISRGILQMPEGRRRDALARWAKGMFATPGPFAGRILPFDREAAEIWAALMAEGQRSGRARSPVDTIIAATALAGDCVVVTDNTRDFPGVPVINPLRP